MFWVVNSKWCFPQNEKLQKRERGSLQDKEKNDSQQALLAISCFHSAVIVTRRHLRPRTWLRDKKRFLEFFQMAAGCEVYKSFKIAQYRPFKDEVPLDFWGSSISENSEHLKRQDLLETRVCCQLLPHKMWHAPYFQAWHMWEDADFRPQWEENPAWTWLAVRLGGLELVLKIVF